MTVAVAIVFIVAGWLRMRGLLDTPLWLDEAYSAYAVENGFRFIWTVVPTYDTHPPLYYTLLGLWSLLASDSLAGLRLLGVLAGLATLGVAALAGREIARWTGADARVTAGAAVALVALSPLMVDMSRQVRPYPLMILVYAVAVLAMLHVGRVAASSGRLAKEAFIVYLVALELTCWLHNVGPLFGVSLTLAFVALVAGVVRDRRDLVLLVGGHVVVAILYLPALAILIDQTPTWVESTWLVFRWQGLHWKLAALWGAAGGVVAVVTAAALMVIGIRRMVASGRVRAVTALGVAAVLPAVLAIVVSVALTPVFLIRTLTAVSIPALLLIAIGVGASEGRARWVSITAVLILLSQMLFVSMNVTRSGPREDWYGTVRWLQQRVGSEDVLYAYPNEGLLPLQRAAGDLAVSVPSRPIPTAVPASGVGWHPTGNRGSVSLPRELLRAIAEEPETRAVQTVWLLRLGPWAFDKDDVFLEELARDRTIVDRWTSGPIDIVGLRRNQE